MSISEGNRWNLTTGTLRLKGTQTKMSALDGDDERQPLLPLKNQDDKITPLPILQTTIICLIRMTEPVAFMVIFPFINQMLLDIDAVDDPKDVGWPAGIVSF